MAGPANQKIAALAVVRQIASARCEGTIIAVATRLPFRLLPQDPGACRIRIVLFGRRVQRLPRQGAQVTAYIGDGVMVWKAPTDQSFDFATVGRNRRMPVDLDGLKLVSFYPRETGEETTPKRW